MDKSLSSKISSATMWSVITELLSKLIGPISTLVLARLLTPEAFGVVATITMLISFTQVFSDAGFQKFIIQYDSKDESAKVNVFNVAFTSNFILSVFLWILLIVFRHDLAEYVGNPGLGNVIAIACSIIPIMSFSSLQLALLRKELKFKSIFFVRLIGIFVPIIVTIPLAFVMKNYWALIIGTIVIHISNALFLLMRFKNSFRFYFDVKSFNVMFSFTSWALIDAILIWLTSYADIFLIGLKFDEYYLGLYKTSMTIVGQIVALVAGVLIPILYPVLSKLKDNKKEMIKVLLKFQKNVGFFIIPMGFAIFLFSEQIVDILLGDKWTESSGFVGLWGLMSCLTIIFSRFGSLVYPAIGKPKLSVLAQSLHLIVLLPVIIIASDIGFEQLYVSRSLVRIQLIIVNVILVYIIIGFSPLQMLKNVFSIILSTVLSFLLVYFLIERTPSTIISSGFFMILYGCIYLIIVTRFREERRILHYYLRLVLVKLSKNRKLKLNIK